jgi:hypothetical protein
MMRIAVVFAVIASIYPTPSKGSAPAKTTLVFSSVTAERPIMLAQESPQVATCRGYGFAEMTSSAALRFKPVSLSLMSVAPTFDSRCNKRSARSWPEYVGR